MTGMGLNIDCANLSDSEYQTLKNYLVRAKPRMVVCMDNYPRAVEIARILPDSVIVYRHYLPDEIWQTSLPSDYINAHAAYGTPPANVWYYALNEPPMNAKVISWLDAVARMARARGWRVCLGNWSIGVPEPQQWSIARGLLELAAANPSRLTIGLHEYWPTYAPYEFQQTPAAPHEWPTVAGIARPWILGRFRFLLDYCKSVGIPAPRIAITEWGTDRIDAVGAWQTQTPGYYQRTGYKVAKCAWSVWPRAGLSVGTYAALMAKWAWRNLYAMHPQIVGVAWFCAGGQGDWRTYYNVLDEPDFLAECERGFEMQTQALDYEIRAQGGTVIREATLQGVAALNVRSIPSTTGNTPTGTIKAGELVRYYGDSEAVNFEYGREKYRWKRLANGGWIAILSDSMLQNTDSAKAQLVERLNAAANAIDAALVVANALPE